ncbi:YkgJ family cysteine cluster protein [Sphingomonas sp. T9W2]|uniref:YkgJ family cysteine cluster protein n=1 Tax=Sphingomonas sp. T9W2 TaxID=3143183 RepID=UPI0031F49479
MHDAAELETNMLGPVLADRSCGDCTACCTVLQVASPDFAKPAGVPCRHLTAAGCGIHAIRPHICRSWFCVWRREADLPEAARPDRSGLLVSMNFVPEPQNCFEGVSINVRLLAGSDAIANGMAARVLDVLCEYLIPVWFSDGDEKMLMHPSPDVARLVLSGTPAPTALHDEVAAWREQYGMFAPRR